MKLICHCQNDELASFCFNIYETETYYRLAVVHAWIFCFTQYLAIVCFCFIVLFYRNIDIYINTSIFLYFISVGEATSSSNGLIMRLISMGRQLLTNIPIVSVFQFPPNLFSNLSYLTKNLIRTIIIVYQKRSSSIEMFPMATHLRLPTLLHLIMFLPIIVMRFYDYLAFIYLDQFSSTII